MWSVLDRDLQHCHLRVDYCINILEVYVTDCVLQKSFSFDIWNYKPNVLSNSCINTSYIHTYIHKSYLYSAYKFKRVTMRFGRQTSKFSEIVWKCQMTVPAVALLVEGRSTGGDRRLRSFCHPVCCVCAVLADSAIHWNPTAAGDGRHPTAGSRQQSSARYAGVTPASDWWTSPATLNTIRCRTGSQCSCCSTGVMWSRRRAPETRRAAAFCTNCKRRSSPSLIPYSSELQ